MKLIWDFLWQLTLELHCWNLRQAVRKSSKNFQENDKIEERLESSLAYLGLFALFAENHYTYIDVRL